MSATTREIIKGLASGAGFLLLAFALDVPLWLSAGLSLGLYCGLSLVLPRTKSDTLSGTPGLSAAERDTFLVSCRKSVAELLRLAAQIPNRAFGEQVKALGQTASSLVGYLEKKPEAILLSYSVPRNLEHLVAMLAQYVAISSYQKAGQTAEDALRKVEEIFGTAADSFSFMYQQLLNNDIAALETSAHTLAILMGVDEESGQLHRAISEPESQIDPPSRVRSALPQKGKM